MLKTPASFIPLHAPQAHPDPYTFVFCGDALLVRDTDLALPDAAACAGLAIQDADLHPVGMWQGRYCRTGSTAQEVSPAPGYTFRKLRSLFGTLDDALMALAGRAFQIAEWARTHRYCGACGSPMALAAHERCFTCANCGMTAYPRISPAMMVLVRKEDAILLARHVASPTNRFSALAGFVEAGESVEEAVHREVREEVGLAVANLRYFGSQSWPFPHSLMIAFTADYAGGEIVLDQNEIAEARWFGPSDPLPEIALGVSIAHALISAHLPRG
ncbi:MAG TPA: NAD(+) diphosphatase [Paucimonas sp.]|nr:NAD(+) diphosphatase [Paucimonas sp.]HJW56279.1 NAD(+) diphosphatase [Burkholderiaceae bacterium]